MINFTVGPVQIPEDIRAIGAEQIPYFRTAEFSALMKENEESMCRLAGAPIGSRALFLTCSGTGAMEAAVINQFDEHDRVLVVNGGSFGARFAKICTIYGIPHEEIKLNNENITAEKLEAYKGQGFTGFLVQALETSTGIHHDLELISDFCREEGIRLVVDDISSFLSDAFDMKALGASVFITGSQKALALPPGLAILVLTPEACERVGELNPKTLYFDLKDALKDGTRGQTPFTCAVSILIQLNARLKQIEKKGIDAESCRIAELAFDFRKKLIENKLPFEISVDSVDLSNSVTPLHPTGLKKNGEPVSAHETFLTLKDEYGIFICPCGGELAHKIFRVGHIGDLTTEDNDKLIAALKDMQRRGLV